MAENGKDGGKRVRNVSGNEFDSEKVMERLTIVFDKATAQHKVEMEAYPKENAKVNKVDPEFDPEKAMELLTDALNRGFGD